jgi:uncharacterized membrane protein
MKRPSVLLVIILLAFSSLIALVALRYAIAGRFSQGFLIWNLVLAAVPVGCAALGTAMAARAASRKRAVAWVVGSFIAWLAFYPNAPYIFTDFIHVIRRGNLGTPVVKWMSELDLLWFDIIMNAAFAFVGHYLGLLSMYIMHRLLRSSFGKAAGWSLLAPAILLSGFGIHLGRFSRFNSWDLIFQPAQAIRAAFYTLSSPASVLFSLAFSFFIALTYLIFYLVTRGARSYDPR